MSACVNDTVKDACDEDKGFIHWSQSCAILDNAVLSRSGKHKTIRYLGMPYELFGCVLHQN